jgi:signal transduction histidine kinase
MPMSVRWSLSRTAVFATLYVLAALLGRQTVIADTRLSMVWPAAGVMVVWFCAQRSARWRWADFVAMPVLTVGITAATGSGLRLATVCALAAVAHAAVFLTMMKRCRPELWGVGGDQPLTRLSQLWTLLAAAVVSSTAGATVSSAGSWLVTGGFSLPELMLWIARNTVGVLLIGSVGLVVGHELGRRRRGDAASAEGLEYVALILCSAAGYVLAFAVNRGLPITFILIVLTVWAGLRASTTFVVLHNLALSAAAVFFTLRGAGPFVTVTDHATRALVAQLFVGAIAVVGLALALGRDERVVLMRALEREKAELAAQRESASRRAELLTAIVDSMADGVSVIDSDGRVVMRNDATARIVGDTGLAGMLRVDSECVYARVMAGEAVARRDVQLGDETTVTITATRLAGEDGRPWAVLVMHDVTAERRHRDELASFAGVVAHDLQSPLTIVEAWSAAAAEALDNGSVAVAQDGLGRVRRAGTRMRNLINDLLTYTTARDSALRSEPLCLDAVVNEVAVARADAAVAAGTPAPRFTIEALPAVLGDPCLMRHLLDNLIGNAIKYTAPEATPHVTVTARLSGPGQAEITIADNGIGIPAGEHAAIFGNFHRAHTGAGYAGTGLGLAICRRIVQRHGGTIRAEDNPGGGTRLVFTLPAAATESAEGKTGDAVVGGLRA